MVAGEPTIPGMGQSLIFSLRVYNAGKGIAIDSLIQTVRVNSGHASVVLSVR